MTKEIIFVAQGGFHYFAEHLCCEVGDLPHLDLAQPVNGTPNVRLNISVVFNPVVQIASIKQLSDSVLFPAACQD